MFWKALLLVEVVAYAWLMFDSLRPANVLQLCRVNPLPSPASTGMALEVQAAANQILSLLKLAGGTALTATIGVVFSHAQTGADLIGAWRLTAVLVGLAAVPIFASAGGRITEYVWRCRLTVGRKQFESRLGAIWMGRLLGLGLGTSALTMIPT